MTLNEALKTYKQIMPYRYNISGDRVESAKSEILNAAREGKLSVSLNELAKEVHSNAIEHGWWEDERGFGELIALCHSELSEALEEYRKGKGFNETYYNTDGKPEGIPSELADVIIRILDICGRYGIDIETMIKEKHEFNKTRPHKHGGKII